jgi:hypothetical protein
VDLDLTLDAEALTAAARTVGEDFYILYEGFPSPSWEPISEPMPVVLWSAVWWTRTEERNKDHFLPLSHGPLSKGRIQLECAIAYWHRQGRWAFSVELLNNRAWSGTNMSGAVVQLIGKPLDGFQRTKTGRFVEAEISNSRGRPVWPVFYHQVGELQYVWFNHYVAVPVVLFDQVVRPLDSVSFTCHKGHPAIHLRKGGAVVGLFRPCDISAPEILMRAREELRRWNVKTKIEDTNHNAHET